MATPALISIDDIVTRYLFKFKLSSEDAFIYTEHLCELIEHYRLYDGNQIVTLKHTVDSDEFIEMPSDMLSLIDLSYPVNGEWVTATKVDTIVNTTTFTGIVEGRDSDFGEGVDILQARDTTYGAKGGVNDYNYMVDWEERRIFTSGMADLDIVIQYISSGIETTGATTVSRTLVPMADAYLKWKSSYWIPELKNERRLLKNDYDEARLELRGLENSMSYNEWRDLLLSLSSQAPIR